MTDSGIIALCREGQWEKAFNELVGLYSERLYWYVRAMVCSHEDADDLLQEIFIKIWTALPSFRGEAQFFTWMYRIATNETLNFLKKSGLRKGLYASGITPEMEQRIESEPYFNGGKAEKLLVKAIASLPEKQRAVFLMRYYDEMKYEDMSEILGTSTGALKASYHFAYKRLKSILKEEF